jgi:hypothetical protein
LPPYCLIRGSFRFVVIFIARVRSRKLKAQPGRDPECIRAVAGGQIDALAEGKRDF